MNRLVALSIIAISVVGCSTASDEPNFRHEVTGDLRPWTHDQFDADEDKFTFAVFSDLTGGERDRIFEIAVAQLSLLRPELIINVGDLIDGGTESLEEIDQQWDSFDERWWCRRPEYRCCHRH